LGQARTDDDKLNFRKGLINFKLDNKIGTSTSRTAPGFIGRLADTLSRIGSEE